MARLIGPRFKIARHLGVNVFNHPKALNRGIKKHTGKTSEYGEQLIEKQKLKMYYGILERQFRRYVHEAFQTARNPGEVLIANLERRLDNLVYRLGFAATLRQARQVVVHGHIAVNNQKVDRPSYRVDVGDIITLRTKGQHIPMLVNNFLNSAMTVPYLDKDLKNFSGHLTRLPHASEVPIEVKIAKVLEFYARR